MLIIATPGRAEYGSVWFGPKNRNRTEILVLQFLGLSQEKYIDKILKGFSMDSTKNWLLPMLKIIAQCTQRNKQNFLCKHSIHQPKIARLIKDQIFTSMKCAEVD